MVDSVDHQLAKAMQVARAAQEMKDKQAASVAAQVAEKVAQAFSAIDDGGDSIVSTEASKGEEEIIVEEEIDTTDDSSIEEKEAEKDLVTVFSANCTSCAYLVAHCDNFKTADKAKCHFTDGNDLCPAQYTRIAIAPDFEKASNGLAEGWTSKDSTRVGNIMRRLSAFDTLVSDIVMDMATQKAAMIEAAKAGHEKPAAGLHTRLSRHGKQPH